MARVQAVLCDVSKSVGQVWGVSGAQDNVPDTEELSSGSCNNLIESPRFILDLVDRIEKAIWSVPICTGSV
jgi:hypothetical protein